MLHRVTNRSTAHITDTFKQIENPMNYTPPAASAYSPSSRALILPNARRSSGHVRNGLIGLYFVLQFWEKPLLQQVLGQILTSWTSATHNSVILNKIVTSNYGVFTGKVVKKILLQLIKAVIKIANVTRAEQVGLLKIPRDIQKWAVQEIIHTGSQSQSLQKNAQSRINADIDKVLKYWFGQYSPETSQKQLWMIAASSEKYREKVDAQINQSFLKYLIELSANEDVRNMWITANGWKGTIAAIIVLDQMSRHILRHYQTISAKALNNNASMTSLPDQKTLDNLALKIAQEFQTMHEDEIKCAMIPIPMMIFALMPLRHKSTLQSVGYVQSKAEEIACLHSVDLENMIRRFRRATSRRIVFLQDEARREGRDTNYDDADVGGDSGVINPFIIEGGQDEGIKDAEFKEEDILEFHRFEANMDDAKKTQVVKTMIQYLNARDIHVKKSSSCNDVKRDTPVIVSLSGGVDSMAIASALAYIRDHCGFLQLYIVAVHIDYGNRPESAVEAAYVNHYARDVLRLDKCIVRRIDEVTRGVTKRDEYELYSRNVRYDLYRQTVTDCIQICGENSVSREVSEVGVMLGHHRGDVVENVISNSNKGCGPLDLSGMVALGKNDGVTIYRPLLSLEKTDVYDYSHKYGVPYFKDTTPHWSTRGKLRNKLIPLLEEVYGDGCLSNLARLAQESDEVRELFNETALKPFMEKVVYYPMGIIFSTKEFANQGTFYWKFVLRHLLHSVGLGMFSDKSTESFLKRVLPTKITSGELQLL